MIAWPKAASKTSPDQYICQSISSAADECLKYLYENLMIYDEINIGSLGFPPDMMVALNDNANDTNHDKSSNSHENTSSSSSTSTSRFLTDGLENGIIGPTVDLALQTRSYPWNQNVPKDIFMEYVLNFANVNEARNNWRPLITDALKPLVETLLESKEQLSVEDVVMTLNHYLWTAFSNTCTTNDEHEIVFQSKQTPLIYDPMSVLMFGYASCTGISILFVDALRALGIPARIAGTPAWYGDPEQGNHSWVEVYVSDGDCNADQESSSSLYDCSASSWRITEALPAAGFVGSLSDPCQYWFCSKERYVDASNGAGDDGYTGTRVYAAKLDKEQQMHFPMAWDVENTGVPGIDVTDYMRSLCAEC